MILYDLKKRKISELNDYNCLTKLKSLLRTTSNYSLSNRRSTEFSISINHLESEYFMEWFNKILSHKTYNLKRDIYLCENSNVISGYYLMGCYIKSSEYSTFDYCDSDAYLDIIISFDYIREGNFIEFLSIYRDFKLNSILNK